MKTKLDEYRIILGDGPHTQRTLNQWNREYDLDIISCDSHIENEHGWDSTGSSTTIKTRIVYSILLTRRKIVPDEIPGIEERCVVI
jgi:hypothetical protein|tara:strand:+ start:3406 stop:3663 length:258 start_codon:yes stop_codon:yes gene_type:complete